MNDAAALVTKARLDDRINAVYLFGHSEGSLIALEVAAKVKVDGIISAAGAGRQIFELMREQLSRQLVARGSEGVRRARPGATRGQAGRAEGGVAAAALQPPT